MNFYKRYPGDYMRDTGALSLAEHGAYTMMLDVYYSTERPLPVGRKLHRLLRCETPTEKKAVDAVVAQFWSHTDDGLINLRAKEELEKAEKIREKNRINGQSGGRPPAKTPKPSGNPTGTQPVNSGFDSGKQHQTPDTRHQTKPPFPVPGTESATELDSDDRVIDFGGRS